MEFDEPVLVSFNVNIDLCNIASASGQVVAGGERTLVAKIAVFIPLIHGLDQVIKSPHNLFKPRRRSVKWDRGGVRCHSRHWTALRTAGLSCSGKRECIVRASSCSLSNAWK
jgi:hypothetical protein